MSIARLAGSVDIASALTGFFDAGHRPFLRVRALPGTGHRLPPLRSRPVCAREKQWTSAGALKLQGSAVRRMSIWLAEKVDGTTVLMSIFRRKFRMVGGPIKPGLRPCWSASSHRASRVHFAGLRQPAWSEDAAPI
jgi:hypothetical protein